MTDAEFLARFSTDAPGKPALWRWRGWPEFDGRVGYGMSEYSGGRLRYRSPGQYLRGTYLIERPVSQEPRTWIENEITEHEAACLVRDFLRVELNKVGWQGHEPTTDQYNAALVAAVEAQIAREEKP